jgi:arylsulfatase A-like enzyme
MKKPNIIYILADDMGYGDVSYLNERSGFKTPHLDQMCEEGLHFTDGHSSSAVCTPSRYSILTGRYNFRSRLKKFVLMGYDTPLIEPGRKTIGKYLQEKNYKTACIGKWHLGLEWSLKNSEDKEGIDYTKPLINTPLDHGFDYFYGISASLDMPPYVYIENRQVTAVPDREVDSGMDTARPLFKKWFRPGAAGADFVHEDVLPNMTNRVLDKIEEYKNDPFFIYFPLTAPHTPILPTKKFQGKSGTNEYGDFVLMCDDVVGQINSKLKELGLDENTIVIYTSDNGCSPMANYSELAQYGHNPSYIFRGTKSDIYEGGHRVPLIVKWPDSIAAGSQADEAVCLTDLYATIADIFGDKIEDNAAEDSVSNLPIWLNEQDKLPVREALVHHSVDGSFSIRKGKWKLEMCPDSGGWSMPKPGTMPENAPAIQLYDLEKDVREKHNVCDQFPEIVKDLRSLLITYIVNGRSTPGVRQKNTGDQRWEQINWIDNESKGTD